MCRSTLADYMPSIKAVGRESKLYMMEWPPSQMQRSYCYIHLLGTQMCTRSPCTQNLSTLGFFTIWVMGVSSSLDITRQFHRDSQLALSLESNTTLLLLMIQSLQIEVTMRTSRYKQVGLWWVVTQYDHHTNHHGNLAIISDCRSQFTV